MQEGTDTSKEREELDETITSLIKNGHKRERFESELRIPCSQTGIWLMGHSSFFNTYSKGLESKLPSHVDKSTMIGKPKKGETRAYLFKLDD